MENFIPKKDLPPPPEEALDYKYKTSSNDWWVKTEKGWYWYDNRTKEWKHAPHGPG